MKVQRTCIPMPKKRLSKDPEEMFRTEANPAPTKDPTVEPKLFIDMNNANKVPSTPGGQSCPDKIRKGMNLQNEEILQILVSYLNGIDASCCRVYNYF